MTKLPDLTVFTRLIHHSFHSSFLNWNNCDVIYSTYCNNFNNYTKSVMGRQKFKFFYPFPWTADVQLYDMNSSDGFHSILKLASLLLSFYLYILYCGPMRPKARLFSVYLCGWLISSTAIEIPQSPPPPPSCYSCRITTLGVRRSPVVSPYLSTSYMEKTRSILGVWVDS
jgi:hypothetical protein